ncbi:MAG TPA: DUF4240 domain-containing protein [Verrucomicrobiae bacterium]|jgi:hypothetical protein|nr:DUF4240 domain-containing protein [Verrucomicrobiae bacterium]
MTKDDFWAIVERVHLASNGDMDVKGELLETELGKLSADEVRSFDGHFSECFHQAYAWNLWDAAYIICGGCSDDGFMDFRSTLISMGKNIFEQAVADPEYLAELHLTGESVNEGYQYVASSVYEEKAGREMPRGKKHPREPKGKQSKEWEIAKRLPRLAAEYGYTDPEDSHAQREIAQREKKFSYTLDAGKGPVAAGKTLPDLLLDSGIIPSSGYIPPFRVVAEVLKHGHFTGANGAACSWESFQLGEGDYWTAVNCFEKFRPKDLKHRKDIQGGKLQLDIKTPASGDYSEWLQSLKERGLV